MREDTIASELPEDYVRRMRNWASATAGEGVWTISSVYEGEFSGRGETRDVTLIGEAQDTHIALMALGPRDQQVITKYWSNEGKGLRWLGRQLGINHETAKARLLRASELHLAELRRRSAAYFAMVEANKAAVAAATADHSRTGAIATRISLLVDKVGIRQ